MPPRLDGLPNLLLMVAFQLPVTGRGVADKPAGEQSGRPGSQLARPLLILSLAAVALASFLPWAKDGNDIFFLWAAISYDILLGIIFTLPALAVVVLAVLGIALQTGKLTLGSSRTEFRLSLALACAICAVSLAQFVLLEILSRSGDGVGIQFGSYLILVAGAATLLFTCLLKRSDQIHDRWTP